MAVEYRLAIAGDIPLDRVVEHAVPGVVGRPLPAEAAGRLSVDLSDRLGFTLIARSGRDGYYEAEDDGGSRWEWEPSTYVNVTFRMAKQDDVDTGVRSMIAAVSRVLTRQTEDATLILNSEVLLLTRFTGSLRKHHRALWWDHYGFVDDILPD